MKDQTQDDFTYKHKFANIYDRDLTLVNSKSSTAAGIGQDFQ